MDALPYWVTEEGFRGSLNLEEVRAVLSDEPFLCVFQFPCRWTVSMDLEWVGSDLDNGTRKGKWAVGERSPHMEKNIFVNYEKVAIKSEN